MKPSPLLLALPLLLAIAPMPACAAAPPMRQDASGCRFLVPADLGAGPARWIGACGHGAAEGPGVLRIGSTGADIRLFAGTMRAGRPVSGYLDTGSADTAGPSLHFRQAEGLPTAARGEAQQACQIAAVGARAAADRLARAGNVASAKFYRGWADTLRRCLDRPE